MVTPGNIMAQSMLDRSRIALCMFMLAIFAFNPFGALLTHASSSVGRYIPSGIRGRAILEAGNVAILIQHLKLPGSNFFSNDLI